MGRKFKLELSNLKEITRECLKVGDLVRLAVYGKVGLRRAVFLGRAENDTFRFLFLDHNKIVEFNYNSHWILNRFYLESRNEEPPA